MAAVVRKKQDDKNLLALRELVTSGGCGSNRQCFDCGQKGPTYVNMTIGSFVCTRCSGVLRGLMPPHRVKSISMATFMPDEIDFLRAHGNELCAKTWLGLWDPKRAVHQDQHELMLDKYERKRYYLEPASPLKSLTNATTLKSANIAYAAAATTRHTNGYAYANNNHIENGIQLTPPTAQRHHNNTNGGSAATIAVSRPQHNNHQQQQEAFVLMNGGTLGGGTGRHSLKGSTSTGAISDTSSCTSNGFGNDADFVADFGAANIFDATNGGSSSLGGSPAVSSTSSLGSSACDGYAKIQSIQSAQHRQQEQLVNSTELCNSQQQHSNNNNSSAENFADFDHAPIYNATAAKETNAANYQFVRKGCVRRSSFSVKQQQQRLQQLQQQRCSASEIATITMFADEFNDDDLFANLRVPQQRPTNATTTTTTTIATKNYNNSGCTAANTLSGNAANFNDPFDDFYTITSNDGNNHDSAAATWESDYQPQPQAQLQEQHNHYRQQQHQQRELQKFTPLAMAAHATALAVLGSNFHFNNEYNSDIGATTLQQKQQQQQQLHQSSPATQYSGDSRSMACALATKRHDLQHANCTTTCYQASGICNNDNNTIGVGVLSRTREPYAVAAPSAYRQAHNSGNGSINSYLQTPAFTPALVAPADSARSTFHNYANSNTTNEYNNINGATQPGSQWLLSYPSTNPFMGLPISNSVNKNTTSANSSNKTPREDRYAALKDLDEQLRESKAVATATVGDGYAQNGNSVMNGSNGLSNGLTAAGGSINPFQNQQQAAVAPMSPYHPYAAQMGNIPNSIAVNDYAGPTSTAQLSTSPGAAATAAAAAAAAAAVFYNYSSGGGGLATVTGPNGCGFGTMQQQIAANGGMAGGAFNNPFAPATGAMNSNNPFL